MTIERLTSGYVDALAALFDRLPESDLTFMKEDVSAAAVERWSTSTGRRWVDVGPDGAVDGLVALLPLTGWSDHVAEIRLVVDPDTRGRGIGRTLAEHAVGDGIRAGLLKIVVEVPAAQQPILDMFMSLGFTGEALLRDHFRDRSGRLQDLVLLALLADQTFEAMSAVGVGDLLEGPGS